MAPTTTTTNQHTHALLPLLPPELRNEIYAYVSDPAPRTAASGSSFALPFQQKVFTHPRISTTTIILAQSGAGNGLLALSRYAVAEAAEYRSWLLAHGLEVRIRVVFCADLRMWRLEDWKKQMQTHLRKLVKGYGFLASVRRWSVEVVWEPVGSGLADRNAKKMPGVGDVVPGLVECLLGVRDGLAREKGRVEVVLGLGERVGVDAVLGQKTVGLAGFLEGLAGLEGVVTGVVKVGVMEVVGWKDGKAEGLAKELTKGDSFRGDFVLGCLEECGVKKEG
ncbi:hypothetical protein BCR34DRAFT_605229 [Clohesyomyces aquaticus]|uniref:Uncharacterized protein n=1 Tax=Clohesyomyces aquaticus TaxID=1231657 RepID=A0A1Y1YZM1_9PLEO|nr:hypothetical protein BCR34DRAFT_605229 [Clohesyomyces aquaticus]